MYFLYSVPFLSSSYVSLYLLLACFFLGVTVTSLPASCFLLFVSLSSFVDVSLPLSLTSFFVHLLRFRYFVFLVSIFVYSFAPRRTCLYIHIATHLIVHTYTYMHARAPGHPSITITIP
ncbi:hypothetical protein R3P38DRAFT_2834484, partial [Favolaschia claudopus]